MLIHSIIKAIDKFNQKNIYDYHYSFVHLYHIGIDTDIIIWYINLSSPEYVFHFCLEFSNQCGIFANQFKYFVILPTLKLNKITITELPWIHLYCPNYPWKYCSHIVMFLSKNECCKFQSFCHHHFSFHHFRQLYPNCSKSKHPLTQL